MIHLEWALSFIHKHTHTHTRNARLVVMTNPCYIYISPCFIQMYRLLIVPHGSCYHVTTRTHAHTQKKQQPTIRSPLFLQMSSPTCNNSIRRIFVHSTTEEVCQNVFASGPNSLHRPIGIEKKTFWPGERGWWHPDRGWEVPY